MAQPVPPPALPISAPQFSADLSDALAELRAGVDGLAAYDTDDAPMDALVRLRILDSATSAIFALDVESSAPMSTVFASFCAASSAEPGLHSFYLARDAPGSAPLDDGDTAVSRGLSTTSDDVVVARLKVIFFRIRCADGREHFFKAKRTTVMGKVFEAFYQKENMLSGTFDYSLRGVQICAEDTADSLSMSENDVIDAVVRSGDDDDVPIFFSPETVVVRVRYVLGDGPPPPAAALARAAAGLRRDECGEIRFKIKRTTLMSRVFAAFSEKRNEQPGGYDFSVDGEPLQPEETADSRRMTDDTIIDAVVRDANRQP